MTKNEHLQFLVLMIPTFVILVAAAASMADLALPASSPSELYYMAGAHSQEAPQQAIE
jgi:hypothetical protein